jgi:hypothetical protein
MHTKFSASVDNNKNNSLEKDWTSQNPRIANWASSLPTAEIKDAITENPEEKPGISSARLKNQARKTLPYWQSLSFGTASI